MLFCKNCGKEIDDNTVICPHCGVSQEEQSLSQTSSGGGLGVASLVLGIISIVIGAFSGGSLGWIGAPIGIVGIILGAIGRKNAPEAKKGLANAGFVCSIIGTILCILFYVACIACIGAIGSAM